MARIALGLMLLFLAGCTKVPPGYEGIKVNNYGDQRGVADFPVQVGMVWFNPFTTDVYRFPTFIQREIWQAGEGEDESITVRSVEGTSINVDIAIAYKFREGETPAIFVEFRQSLQVITDGYMRDRVRDALVQVAGDLEVMSMLGPGVDELQNEARDVVNRLLTPKGIEVESLSIVGKPRVDGSVEQSINAVIAQVQQANQAQERERQIQAEARQRVAAAQGEAEAIRLRAAAQAEANRLLNESLTSQVLRHMALEKWDGVQPRVLGSNTDVLLSLGDN